LALSDLSKAHLDQTLAQAKIEVPATSKIWDAYRAYEKKLTTAKEKGNRFPVITVIGSERAL
jgi:hypothetical protein